MKQYKNLLQEYCQKNKINLPKYESYYIGKSNDPIWFSMIIINNAEYSTNIGKKNKVEAETLAAKKIYKAIMNIDTSKNIYNNEWKEIYLIDLESSPCFNYNKFKEDSIYIGFINSLHCTVDKYNWTNFTKFNKGIDNKQIVIIEGEVKDLADHLLTFYSYQICDYIKSNNINPIINIVTADHCGMCTYLCIKHLLGDKIEIKRMRKL